MASRIHCGITVRTLVVARVWRTAPVHIGADYAVLALAGLIVGLGTRYGSGCTSGHGVCGLSRLSPRSLVATLLFIMTGMVAVYVIRHGLS